MGAPVEVTLNAYPKERFQGSVEYLGKQIDPTAHYDVHEVLLGEEALGKVRIVSGLREHELVVVDGVFTLKSAVMKSSFGEAE